MRKRIVRELRRAGMVALLVGLAGLGGAAVWSAAAVETTAIALVAAALILVACWSVLGQWSGRLSTALGLLLALGAACVVFQVQPWAETFDGDRASATVTGSVLVGLLLWATFPVALIVAGAFGRLPAVQVLVGIGASLLAALTPAWPGSLTMFAVVGAITLTLAAVGLATGSLRHLRYWLGLAGCIGLLLIFNMTNPGPFATAIPLAVLLLACVPFVLARAAAPALPRPPRAWVYPAAALVPVVMLGGWVWASGAMPDWAEQRVARSGHGATLLPDGRVLVEGGTNAPPSNGTALVYDPATGNWSRTSSLNSPRTHQADVLLRTSEVLAIGGGQGLVELKPYLPPASAEIYAPSDGTWRRTADGLDYPSAVVLQDGRVLVLGIEWRAGGPQMLGPSPLSAGLYDATGKTWSDVPSPPGLAAQTGLALLPDGRALLIGTELGPNGPTGTSRAVIFDPATEAWTAAQSPAEPRAGAAVVPLPDGRVLLAGGGWSTIVSSAEIYDPAANVWQAAGSMQVARNEPSATLLRDGRVLVSGGHSLPGGAQPSGFTRDQALASVDIFDSHSGEWSLGAPMLVARTGHSLSVLPDGRVLSVGGAAAPYQEGLRTSAEIYDPATDGWAWTGDMAGAVRGDLAPFLLALGLMAILATGVFGFLLGLLLPAGPRTAPARTSAPSLRTTVPITT